MYTAYNIVVVGRGGRVGELEMRVHGGGGKEKKNKNAGKVLSHSWRGKLLVKIPHSTHVARAAVSGSGGGVAPQRGFAGTVNFSWMKNRNDCNRPRARRPHNYCCCCCRCVQRTRRRFSERRLTPSALRLQTFWQVKTVSPKKTKLMIEQNKKLYAQILG